MPILKHRETSIKGLAEILRTSEQTLLDFQKKMEAITGKKDVLQRVVFENNVIVERTLIELGLGDEDVTAPGMAEKIYDTLIHHLIATDSAIFEILNKPNLAYPESVAPMIRMAFDLSGVKTGFFLKEEKAKELLIKNPPPTIIKMLGYKDVFELLEKESIWEIYSALRFLESPDWMNDVFLKSYQDLKPRDFEEREIRLFVLPRRWLELAEKFMTKKYHNLSHLKELGVIFIIPITLDISGETLRLLSLALHYLHEVPFYSRLFRKYAAEPATFAENLISLLRGDVLEGPLPDPEPGKINIRIIQRYLAKDDPRDFRLFEPHVNPETRHWDLAEGDLIKLTHYYPALYIGFWAGVNWAGDCFLNQKGEDDMVGLNLVDTTMSVVQRDEMIKYLYHHQEALWNQIFIRYIGIKEMDRLMEENILKGYFTLG